MDNRFSAKATTVVNAPPSKVWAALTDPKLIKQYLFGTEVTSDWKVGSSITYKGEWQGRAYEDKGEILQFEPEKLLVSIFWSSLSGLPDSPENEGTRITVTQDNNASQEEADHSQQDWNTVLDELKKLLEK